ncbi:MAG: tetratricopeptide repeat protein [Myxococcota bacterium]
MRHLLQSAAAGAVLFAIACGGSSQTGAPSAGARGPSDVSYDDLVGLSESYIETGKPDRAVEVAEDATKKDNTRPEGYLALGRALAANEQLEQSIEAYEQARERGAEGQRVTLELATLYDVVRRYDAAIEIYRVHLTNHPEDAEAHQQLGLTFLLAGRAERAVGALEKALAIDPDNGQMRIDYGMALLRAGKVAASAKTLESVTSDDPERADAWRLLARADATQKAWPRAIKHVDRALALQPEDVEALSLRCRLRVIVGERERALEDCTALRELDPENKATQLRTSGLLASLGQLEDASALVRSVANELPDHPAVRFRQDQIAARSGDSGAFKRIVALANERGDDPELWWEVHALATLRKDRNLRKKAVRTLKGLGITAK